MIHVAFVGRLRFYLIIMNQILCYQLISEEEK